MNRWSDLILLQPKETGTAQSRYKCVRSRRDSSRDRWHGLTCRNLLWGSAWCFLACYAGMSAKSSALGKAETPSSTLTGGVEIFRFFRSRQATGAKQVGHSVSPRRKYCRKSHLDTSTLSPTHAKPTSTWRRSSRARMWVSVWSEGPPCRFLT